MRLHTLATAALALAATGCGYQQETFAQDFATSTCLLYDQCAILETYGGYEDLQSCQKDLKTQVNPEQGRCPEYDKKAATTCIDAINSTTCEQFIDGYWPQQCATTCPDGSATIAPPTSEQQDEADTGA